MIKNQTKEKNLHIYNIGITLFNYTCTCGNLHFYPKKKITTKQ